HLNKRLEGMPLQYITGTQEFMGLDFMVNQDVLIPRPDTEILVENVLKAVDLTHPSGISIFDIGCGSGAIGVSLAYYASKVDVSCVDISCAALKAAKQNAVTHNVHHKMHFFEGDIFAPIKHQKFDMIVSNPPYIPDESIDSLQIEVSKYEPRSALAGGKDGLDFYRRIVKDAPHYLKNNGLIFLEIGYDQAAAVKDLLKSESVYDGIEVIKDLAGHDRVVKARG
ncbi:MAG: peptide chain release factor N(5)-glutamine methyltransferase, partial [Clostridia bacterium]|nr:peptide chain release factor N(5)-glutamine methyltransferase [Clostridia bacterium]